MCHLSLKICIPSVAMESQSFSLYQKISVNISEWNPTNSPTGSIGLCKALKIVAR